MEVSVISPPEDKLHLFYNGRSSQLKQLVYIESRKEVITLYVFVDQDIYIAAWNFFFFF